MLPIHHNFWKPHSNCQNQEYSASRFSTRIENYFNDLFYDHCFVQYMYPFSCHNIISYICYTFFLSFLRRDCLSLHRIFSVNVPIRTMVHCISIPANDTNGACSDPENVSPPVCFEPWTSSTISRCTNNCSTTVLILCNLNVQTESSDNCLLFKEHETSKRN